MIPKQKHIKSRDFFLLALAGITIAILINNLAFAQEPLRLEPGGRPGEKRPPLIEEEPPKPPPTLILPPPSPPKEEIPGELPLERVYIKKIIVTGSTVFSEKDLAKVTAPYENRELTNEDLEALRKDLTFFYINNGYITSGAIIPDQNVIDGVISLKIIEGELKNIEIEKNKWLRDSFYRKRIALGAEPPLKIDNLQKRLSILQEDPRIQRLNAELKPGAKRGESDLKVTVEEKIPIKFWTGYDNYISDSVGGEQVQATGAILSLTESGDILSVTYGRADGLNPKIDAWYSLPFTARDTTLTLRYRKNSYDLVREEFEDLDIETDTDIYSIRLRHPIYKSLNHEVALALIGEHQKQETTLLDIPFSFEPGSEDGETKVTALRFEQEWTYRTQTQVIAANSRFSKGIDALDATKREPGIPDGEFFAWLGQFQWARRFKPLDTQLIFRSYLQFTDDPLVSLEQFAVGGRYTVRGYPENFFVRDKAVVASLESRISLIRDKPWADYIQVAPFFDYGWAENEDFPTPPGTNNIYSIGVGLRWSATLFPKLRLKPQFEVYWGHQLKDVDTDVDNKLQDKGISLQFAISVF